GRGLTGYRDTVSSPYADSPPPTQACIGIFTWLGNGSDRERHLDGITRVVGDERLPDLGEREAMGEQTIDLDRSRRQQLHRLRELVLVDHGPDDAELAPNHPEEVERGRLVR